MVQATGGGEYWGEYGKINTAKTKTLIWIMVHNIYNHNRIFFAEGVKAKVYIKASQVERNSQKYLHLEDLKMDFSVKDIQMGIKNVHNGNAVLGKSDILITNYYVTHYNRD